MALTLSILLAVSALILVALAAVLRHGYRVASGHHDRHAELLRIPQRPTEPERRAA